MCSPSSFIPSRWNSIAFAWSARPRLLFFLLRRNREGPERTRSIPFLFLQRSQGICSFQTRLFQDAVQCTGSATSQLAQTTLRSVCGQVELDEILAEREKINTQLQEILDRSTDPWGIKITTVEVKHIDLPQEMQRAMAKQAEAERERRAKVIAAEGEFQAAQKLTDAGKMMAEQPIALQLRYLQTLTIVAAENNSTTLFPIPIDLFKPFMELIKK